MPFIQNELTHSGLWGIYGHRRALKRPHLYPKLYQYWYHSTYYPNLNDLLMQSNHKNI